MQLLGRKAIGRTRCPDARALLPSYIEGELDAHDRERVAGHLHICASCRGEEKQFRAALNALAAAEPVASPGDLYVGFAARLDHIHRGDRRRAAQFRWAGAAAGLLLVAAVGASPLLQQVMQGPIDETAPIVKARPGAARKVAVAPPKRDKPIAIAPPTISTRQEGAIVQPAPLEEEPRAAAPRPKIETPPVMADTFLDVKPSKGPSARAQLTSKVTPKREEPDMDIIPTIPDRGIDRPAKSDFITDRNERIQVGDTVTDVQTGYRIDEKGRRTVVNVNIGTSTVP